MSSFSIQEAQDLATFGTHTATRLAAATARFDEAHDERVEERSWLEAASRRVAEALQSTQAALLAAAPLLPEFASTRKVKVETLSNAWADAVEAVFDGIIANVSGNGPLVEALFPHQRFESLRRPGTAAHNFWLEFERRSESSYVKRLRCDPAYDFLTPLLEAAKAAEQALRGSAAPKALPEAQAEALRAGVSAGAESLELAVRQARSLCEAVFVATPSAIAELGLDAKPKRRAQRSEAPKLTPS